MSPRVFPTATTSRAHAQADVALKRLLVCGPVRPALVASDLLLSKIRPTRITDTTIGQLFPGLSSAERQRLHREISTHFGRSRMVEWYVRYRKPEALRSIVTTSGFERLTAGPAIFMSCHFSAWSCLDTVLRWHGYESLVITAVRSRPTGALLRIGSTLEERTAIAQRAAAHLRAGGFVMMAGDGMAGDVGIPVDVLSQKPLVRPGLATLARISRAPVFPVSGTWDGHRIHVRLHDPLKLPETTERDAFLQGTAERIGSWLDHQIRTHPEGLTPGLVRWLFNTRFTTR